MADQLHGGTVVGRFARVGSGRIDDPIRSFWIWWKAEGAAESAVLARAGARDPVHAVIQERLQHVHPDLIPLVQAGKESEFLLIAWPARDDARRTVAERWWRASPAPDAVWSFAPSRPRAEIHPDQMFGLSNSPSAPRSRASELRCTWRLDEFQQKLWGCLVHPSFAHVDDTRLIASEAIVSLLLGEDDRDRWTLGLLPVPAANDGVPLRSLWDLKTAVDELAASRPAPQKQWSVRLVEVDGLPHVLRHNPWARWMDNPLLTLRHRVVAPFAPKGSTGLPSAEDERWLKEAEAELERLVPGASMPVVITGDGVRVFTLYTDETDTRTNELIVSWARQRDFPVSRTRDPGWTLALSPKTV